MDAREQHGRRPGVLAVHSLARFVFTVPDMDEAEQFYAAFGLDPRRGPDRLDLFTVDSPHCWSTLRQAPGPKRLQYLTFACYPADYEPLVAHFSAAGIAPIDPHPLGDGQGVWIRHPDGFAIQLIVGPKNTPDHKAPPVAADSPRAGPSAAPMRSQIRQVRPRRLSHILLFSADPIGSSEFFQRVLGLRLSDRSGDLIAFLHGAHGGDHHLVAMVKSDGPGLHHSSWDVARLDDVGLGMEQMLRAGHGSGWGLGRHVLGSNYFYYCEDPWGSFAEYSYDIDHVPADVEWPGGNFPPDDSFYLWGPAVPAGFTVNHETAIQSEPDRRSA